MQEQIQRGLRELRMMKVGFVFVVEVWGYGDFSGGKGRWKVGGGGGRLSGNGVSKMMLICWCNRGRRLLVNSSSWIGWWLRDRKR